MNPRATPLVTKPANPALEKGAKVFSALAAVVTVLQEHEIIPAREHAL